MTFREHPQRPILETCDLWDTDYIDDNWEQQYEQLHCDLWIESDGDSIRNSCDVCISIIYIVYNPKVGVNAIRTVYTPELDNRIIS